MTREEAIEHLKEWREVISSGYRKAVIDMAIEDIERWRTWSHTYDNTISRQGAIDAFGLSEKTRKYGGDHSGYDTMMLYEIQDVLESLPSADRPTGEWIKSHLLPNGWHCSHCDAPVMTDDISEMLYCPNCGTRMTSYKGGEDE